MATRQPTIEFAPPEVVTEIGFVETLASIQEAGIHPVLQRGIDGYHAIRLYEAKNPAYIWELTESEVTRAFENGADVVVCISERMTFIAPGNPYTLDRPVRFCGCAPDSTLCACLEILHCVTPDAGFTQDLDDHRTLAQCVDQATNDEQDLYTAMENNHAWADGKNIPGPETGGQFLGRPQDTGHGRLPSVRKTSGNHEAAALRPRHAGNRHGRGRHGPPDQNLRNMAVRSP